MPPKKGKKSAKKKGAAKKKESSPTILSAAAEGGAAAGGDPEPAAAGAPAGMTAEEASREMLECARYGEAPELQQLVGIEGSDVNFKGGGGNSAIHLGTIASYARVPLAWAPFDRGARSPPRATLES